MAGDREKRPQGRKKTSAGALRAKRKQRPKACDAVQHAAEGQSDPNFPVAGIGASAGGVKALRNLFKAMPDDSGLAFVVVLHLDPEHESLMADLIGHNTAMPVVTAEDGMAVAQNHVYVIPPKRHLRFEAGVLRLVSPRSRPDRHLPVDRFFRSLADGLAGRAVAVILSGSGTDGALGARAVKEQGGLVVAQDPAEAEYNSMPRSAIETGAVDYVLPLHLMPKALVDYARQPYVALGQAQAGTDSELEAALPEILTLLQLRTPMDFTPYKKGTLQRRIARRMGINHLATPAAYLEYLLDNQEEVNLLYKDLLIGVTSFFREPDAFTYLAKEVLPALLARHKSVEPLRVWVPGCSTGEEAYSLAMVFIEVLSASKKRCGLQLFATDIDEDALATARLGIYPESIGARMSPERLRRFFRKEDHTYRVTDELRDSCVFAVQNLLHNAPFSTIDLVSCRNVLIYIERGVQRKLIQLFHFALKPDGILFLGTSETISTPEQGLFVSVSKKHHIYRRIGQKRHAEPLFPVVYQAPEQVERGTGPTARAERTKGPAEIMRAMLLEQFAPAAVLTNRQYQALFFAGPVDRYFRVADGRPSQSLLTMARSGLRAGLRNVIDAVFRTGQETILRDVRVSRNGGSEQLRLIARPARGSYGLTAVVAIVEEQPQLQKKTSDEGQSQQSRIEELERELEASRRELESTIVELQSTNEELGTSKEEQQSLNEELITINNQLQERLDELRVTNTDLVNLFSSTDIATLFLDRHLKIKRFTQAARRLFNVISADVGRSVADITRRFADPELFDDAENVLSEFVPQSREIRTDSGEWFNRHIVPYRTEDGGVDGVVITLAEITALKKAEIATREGERRLQLINDAAPMLIGYIDRDYRYQLNNAAFERWFDRPREQITGQHVRDVIGAAAFNDLKPALDRALAGERSRFDGRLDMKYIGARDLIIELAPERDEWGQPLGVFSIAIDVTEFKHTQEVLEASEARLRAILETAPVAVITINDVGMVQSFSASAERIFGYKPDEVVGQNVKMLMPAPYHEEHDSYIARYLATGEKRIIGIGREVMACRKDGTEFPVELAVGEVDPDGKRLFTGFLLDLTDRKRLEAELRQSQKMEAIGQLTGGLAHDFNNLLTVIIGNVEMLESRIGKNSRHKDLLVQTLEAAQSAADLTRRLLGFSRKGPLNVQSIDLSAALLDMQQIIRRTVEEFVEISIDQSPDPTPARMDVSLFENAVLNLVLNARDAMPEGGKLKIETTNVDLDQDYAAGHPGVAPGSYVLLSVSDSGIGMTQEVQEKAFDPFFTTKDLGRGTGLGLSMVKSFARQHGGHVTLYSWPGRGTTIRLYLPRAQEVPIEALAKPAYEEEPQGKGETILVVEDDSRVRMVAARLLDELHYRVLEAENGQHAIKLLDAGPQPDLVFSDVVLPGNMNGQQLRREIRHRFPGIAVLLTSGYASPDGEEQEIPEVVLAKPYTRAELARKIRAVLDA